jgi:hypothetical protein
MVTIVLCQNWLVNELIVNSHKPNMAPNLRWIIPLVVFFWVLMRTTSQTSQWQNVQDSQNWNTLTTYDVGGPSLLWNLINQIEHASTPSCYLSVLSKKFQFQVKIISNQWFYLPFQYMVEIIFDNMTFQMGIIIPKQIGFEDANPLCSFNGSNIIWQGPKLVPKVWDSMGLYTT